MDPERVTLSGRCQSGQTTYVFILYHLMVYLFIKNPLLSVRSKQVQRRRAGCGGPLWSSWVEERGGTASGIVNLLGLENPMKIKVFSLGIGEKPEQTEKIVDVLCGRLCVPRIILF